ncbi:uncharacterized protein UHOD_03308 [Ustilago sp. UG-2017b]|nr:uncharacterized protein UHOD_03308 [Ustilago sp. UG-2017b]
MTEATTSTSNPPPAVLVAGEPRSITNHIIQIPHPQFPFFLTQIVHLSSSSSTAGSSLFVHVTSIPATTAHTLLPNPNPTASTSSAPQTSEEEALDAELSAALAAAGRSTPPSQPSYTVPLGALAEDFALAMCPALPSPTSSSTAGGYRREPISTTISTTSTSSSTTSLASSISKRIASKLSLPQLLLSLSVPNPLLPQPGRIQSAQDSHALLALEKGLRDACSLALSTHVQ